jgi:hypothetical protein
MIYNFISTNYTLCKNGHAVILLPEVYFEKENPHVIRHFIVPDKTCFELSSSVNTQSVQYWSEDNPHEVRVKQTHSYE